MGDKCKTPKECTPEQIAKCHPDAKGGHPCVENAREHPEECTPEQIAKCHPDAKGGHPCVEDK